MLTIETKEFEIIIELKRKIEIICKFARAKPTIANGNIKSIKGTNIAYITPHIIKVNNIDYLMLMSVMIYLLMVMIKIIMVKILISKKTSICLP